MIILVYIKKEIKYHPYRQQAWDSVTGCAQYRTRPLWQDTGHHQTCGTASSYPVAGDSGWRHTNKVIGKEVVDVALYWHRILISPCMLLLFLKLPGQTAWVCEEDYGMLASVVVCSADMLCAVYPGQASVMAPFILITQLDWVVSTTQLNPVNCPHERWRTLKHGCQGPVQMAEWCSRVIGWSSE